MFENQVSDDVVLFGLDMERQYQDPSWGLDQANLELQVLAQEQREQEFLNSELALEFEDYIQFLEMELVRFGYGDARI